MINFIFNSKFNIISNSFKIYILVLKIITIFIVAKKNYSISLKDIFINIFVFLLYLLVLFLNNKNFNEIYFKYLPNKHKYSKKTSSYDYITKSWKSNLPTYTISSIIIFFGILNKIIKSKEKI